MEGEKGREGARRERETETDRQRQSETERETETEIDREKEREGEFFNDLRPSALYYRRLGMSGRRRETHTHTHTHTHTVGGGVAERGDIARDKGDTDTKTKTGV